jgi:hypothetical protein
MTLDSEQTRGYDGFANKDSQKPSTLNHRPTRGAAEVAWEDRLSELVDYRKSTGNAPKTTRQKKQVGNWVATKGTLTGCKLEGKDIYDTLPFSRIGKRGFRMGPVSPPGKTV